MLIHMMIKLVFPYFSISNKWSLNLHPHESDMILSLLQGFLEQCGLKNQGFAQNIYFQFIIKRGSLSKNLNRMLTLYWQLTGIFPTAENYMFFSDHKICAV